jgi:hypothetical protein
MHNAVHEALQGCWPELRSVLADCCSLSAARLQLRIVTNGDFVEQIIQPVLDRMDQVADTSALFLRAQQLVRFSEVTPRRAKTHRNSAPANGESDSEPKIGEYVRQTIIRLASAGKLTPKVVADLSDRSKCKPTFGLNHPFLKKVTPDAPLHAQGVDDNGYSRYWRDPLEIDDARFLVCSQWFVWQRSAFDRWVVDLQASEAADSSPSAKGADSPTSAAGLRSLFRFTR